MGQQHPQMKKVLLEVSVCCPLAIWGGWFQFLIPVRRESVKLEQEQRRAVGMCRMVKNRNIFLRE